MKRIIKYLMPLFIFSNIISCNGQDKNISKKLLDSNKISKINFLDKKYFRYYELDANSKYPQSWFNDKKIGEFTVMYIAKSIKQQKEWEQFDLKNNLVIEAEVTPEYTRELNILIKNKLEPNLSNYYIISEFIPSKYIKTSRDYIDYIYPYIKTYYIYREEKKIWIFLKEKSINDGSDEKNITKLSDLNNMLNIKETDENTLPKFTDSTEISQQLASINDEDDLGALIFIKNDGKLFIREDILDYIYKNTTASKNKYEMLLQKYVTHQIIKFYDENKRQWTKEQLIKIIAYASNTTDPLHKKFWKQSPENWHNGMWGYILGFCYVVYPKTLWIELQTQLKKENYYNLPYIKEMISYALEFDRFGPP